MTGKRIALVCSNRMRDLDYLIFLKIELEKRGHKVLLMPQEGHDSLLRLEKFMPHIYVQPSIMDNKTLALSKYLKNCGSKIVELKVEEIFPDFMKKFGANKYEDSTILDAEIIWGYKMRDLLYKYSNIPKEKIFVCGCARFDIYKKKGILLTKDKFCEKYGLDKNKKIVTYATGFPAADYDDKMIKGIYGNLQKAVDLKEYSNKVKKTREAIFGILIKLIRKFPEINFIIKIHPLELVDFYNKNTPRDIKNLTYLKGEYMMPDIINITDMLIHTNSTTSVEAWFRNLPTICLYPNPDKSMLTEWNAGGDFVEDYTGLEKWVSYYLKGGKISSEKLKARKKFVKEFLYKVDGKAVKRIADILDKIAKETKEPRRIINGFIFSEELKYLIRKLFMIPDNRSLLFWIKHNRYYDRVFSQEQMLKREKYFRSHE